ncbi:restriction endonuclease subunit S [Neisseria elongata]|uniref:restriction endonuclease subunit S n=1 Tax=Neisseria elongata TaxID=495 RepID=UPI00080A84F1|nr:restriction endonuclease subunit S [Neisseria elongata]
MTAEQQLPEGWKKYNLFDICRPKQWKTIAVKDLKNEGYPVYGANGIIGFHNEFNHEKETLLIGCRGSCGEIHISQPKSYINGNAMCLDELSDNILLYYLYYFLKGYNFKSIISGSTQPQITQIGLRKVEIPIPPLETQQAIVNKIESLFDEIDEGIGRLKTAAQQIQQYRQSLLKNAFNGELTKEWRSKHADALPSENELLAQIQTTREQHHAQQLASWQTAVSQWEQNGKEGKKPSKPKAPTQAVKFEENSENRNKNSYIRIPIGFFIETPKYGTSKKCEYEKYENSTGVIRIPNITENGLINLEDMKYAEFSTEDKTDYALKKGDLLLIRSNGSVNIVGSVGLVGLEETNYIYAGYLIRLRPIQGIVNSRFLKFAFQSLDVRTQIEFKAKSTSGVNNINAQEVQDLQVNVFSLPEQTQIVAILESKLTACDQLAAELAKQLKQADLLKQAVLKAAFSGSLLDK